MQDSPGEGLPLFPDAAERYSPELFSEWQAAKAALNCRPVRRSWSVLRDLATGHETPIDENAPWKQAEYTAKQNVVRDVVGKLSRGELVARGSFYEQGKPVVPSGWLDEAGNIKPRLWDEWRGGYGERLRFGDYSAKCEVRRLQVYASDRRRPMLQSQKGQPLTTPDGASETKLRFNDAVERWVVTPESYYLSRCSRWGRAQ